MLLEKTVAGEVFYVLLQLDGDGERRSIIVPLDREGECIDEDIVTHDGRPLADVQPGQSLIVRGLTERVLHIDLYEPAEEEIYAGW